jgi:hypothetical protein
MTIPRMFAVVIVSNAMIQNKDPAPFRVKVLLDSDPDSAHFLYNSVLAETDTRRAAVYDWEFTRGIAFKYAGSRGADGTVIFVGPEMFRSALLDLELSRKLQTVFLANVAEQIAGITTPRKDV